MASVVKRPAPIPRWFWFASMLGCTPGFRRSRCKKLLKVTMSRIKLLRSRRDVQVRQLRRDVAQLLQLGQEENAENRLDRLWKEQSLLSAYTKTAEYCQLVKANLSNIALPRECPVDLKEPIASLCFAASCCADLPELQGIRDIMVAKYGKDCFLSAHELLPGKHVNKMFLEAFATKELSEVSRKALLKGISKEYNVAQPKKPKCPPNYDSQKVQPASMPACAISQKQQPRDVNGLHSDCNQHRSQLASEKEEEQKYTRPIELAASKPTYGGQNEGHALKVQAKKLGQHKQGPKNVHVQLEQGATDESTHELLLTLSSLDKHSTGRSRRKGYRNTAADDGGGNRHLSSKQKSNKNSLEPESTELFVLHGYHERPLTEYAETKGHPKGSGKMLKEKSKSAKEVNHTSRGKHGHGEACPLKAGEDKPTYEKNENDVLRGRQHSYCDEAVSRGFRANGMQEHRVLQHDSDRTLFKRQTPNSECNHVKTTKGHSKMKELSRPASECDYMQNGISFQSDRKQMYDEQQPTPGAVACDVESEQPSWRKSECNDSEKVQRERKNSSKDSLHDPAEIESLIGAYSNAHISQKMRKRHQKKHHCSDVQQEFPTGFSELLPDGAKLSFFLPECYKDNECQSAEAARQRSKNHLRVDNHGIDAGTKSKEICGDIIEARPHESAVGCGVNEGYVPDDPSIHAIKRRSRRTRKPGRKVLNGDLTNKESMQGTIIGENAHGKASYTEGSMTFGNESIERERRHFSQSIDGRESEIASKVKDGQDSYGFDQVNSAKREQRQPKNLDDSEDAKVVKKRSCELDKGNPLPSRPSKPPNRPPPPVPPYRVSSMPSREPLNSPPVLPQRCATLETNLIRAMQEPHVHPKLPDYEDLVASFAALRHKPLKPSASS